VPLGTALTASPQESMVIEAATSRGHRPLLEPSKYGVIRVLLVDDHAMMRQGLRSVLASYSNIEVVGEACDGEEAVRTVGEVLAKVVVMDINMPKMDGIEATRRIRARHPEIVIIGLSVNDSLENHEAMKKAGAALLLTKEEAVEQLYRAIEQAVGQVPTIK